MVLSADRQRVKTLLTETITLLCKNGLHFKTEFSIEALIGITLDEDDVFLVSIKETIRPASSSLTTSDCGRSSELDRLNTADTNVSNGQQVALDYHQVTEFGSNGNENLLQEAKSCPGKSHDDQQNKSEIICRDPKRFGQENLKSSIKRRFSESDDSDLKPEDHEDASIACNSSNARINSDPSFPTSSIFNADYANAEQCSKRSKDGYTERDDNCTEANSAEQLSTDSCEVVEVKAEPCSEDDEPSFRAREPSSGTGFPEPASYFTWNDYAQFNQHEFIASVKPKELHPAGLIIHQSDQQLDQVSHHQRALQTVRQRHQNGVTLGTANLDHSRSHPVQGVPQCNYRYECPYCGKRFAATNNLRGHLVKHTGIKEFVCYMCGNAYAFKQKLKYHMNIIHQLQI